jgi:hypothetical protein
MSADRWGECPRCRKQDRLERSVAQRDLDNLYGKVPMGEFLRKQSDLKDKPALDSTMREDYELYVDEEGIFHINFGCYCKECGLDWTFAKEIDIFQEEVE